MDRLFDADGQTLSELCAYLPGMTRFGVMSHLKVLEEADLVTTHKVGRNKHHYLNPVPIQMIQQRWIAKYAEPTVRRLAGIKDQTERKS